MDFGTLESIPLREAWPNEANDFTPWLAENLDLLSEVVGLSLEPVGIRWKSPIWISQYLSPSSRRVGVYVGSSWMSFLADILAHDPTDDTAVLIENQLEGSDHSHLGQILTYLAGLQAKTVIWIARDFSEAQVVGNEEDQHLRSQLAAS